MPPRLTNTVAVSAAFYVEHFLYKKKQGKNAIMQVSYLSCFGFSSGRFVFARKSIGKGGKRLKIANNEF
jgi:hypothetical protein